MLKYHYYYSFFLVLLPATTIPNQVVIDEDEEMAQALSPTLQTGPNAEFNCKYNSDVNLIIERLNIYTFLIS